MAPTQVTVTVENLAPLLGNFLTPVWFGFHNGNFDTYDGGSSLNAFPGTESLAEDGATQPISNQFAAVGAGSVQGAINSAPLGPGPIPPTFRGSQSVIVDSNVPTNRYFSYASMIIPSNDAFIANGNPLAHPIFDAEGNFIGADFIVQGSQVNDAGTEVNDEIPMNTAFFGQMSPNTGVDENGVVTPHPGFNPPGSGGILDSALFSAANFIAPGYQIARITVSQDTVGNNENETLDGIAVSEKIFGLEGNDIVRGFEGSDNINGNQGDDVVFGNIGDDIVYGGQGNDRVYGGQGQDLVFGDLGSDEVYGDLGNDIVVGGADSDRVFGGEGNDLVMSGPLNDYFQPRTISLEEAQEVTDTPVADTAATGTVTFTPSLTQVQVEGTFSNLTSPLRVVGNPDAEGNPSSSVHIHFGGAGFNGPIVRNLTVTDNGDGSGTLSGTFNIDPAFHARLVAGDYYVNLHTENNPSGELRGQMNVALNAAAGDSLFGDNGDDVLIGGGGNDVLDGGVGSDLVTGATGADTFVLTQGAGPDRILDFENGVDRFGLAGGLTFEQLTIEQGTSDDATGLESSNNVLIRTSRGVTGQSEILAAVAFTSADAIDAGDFIAV